VKHIFYHYTAQHLIPGIQRYGLIRGKTPFKRDDGSLSLLTNTQWLTTDGDPAHQYFLAPTERIPYSRRAYRLRINIPKTLIDQVYPFADLIAALGDRRLQGFDDRPDITENWYCFIGVIPPRWIERYSYTGCDQERRHAWNTTRSICSPSTTGL
jgi:hypothetical protein